MQKLNIIPDRYSNMPLKTVINWHKIEKFILHTFLSHFIYLFPARELEAFKSHSCQTMD
jgi:hypothetical protein